MQVRRFEATTMKDALTAVKRSLGAGAVILSTKELPANADSVKLYEVTAASSVTSKAGAVAEESSLGDNSSVTSDLLSRLAELNEIMPSKAQLRVIEGSIYDIKTLLMEVLRGQALKDDPSGFLFAIRKTLSAAGVDAFIVADLVKHLHTLPPPAEIAKASLDGIEAYYRDQAIRWMMKRIKISPKWNATQGMTSVHVFIGTPGVGKTTLMSKIATTIQKKERHKIALITFGSDKVAAAEQTRIYSKVLDIHHQSISAAHEIKRAVIALKGYDIVLIDTPGQNPNDPDASKQLDTIKALGLSLDFHLVVSATEKMSISERAISCFAPLGISSIAVTKLDECPSYGEAFSLTSRWSIPLSYLTFNGNVDDGLERATRERILERMFNI